MHAVVRLDDAGVEKLLLGVAADPALSSLEDDDFRISLAGAQEKTALTRHQGHWCKPRGATPTTHIFKLPIGVVGGTRLDMTTSLENEWLSAQLLRHYGVPMASCELQQFGTAKALIVTRFDRQLHSSGKYWLRLPQEDSRPPARPVIKSTSLTGGPGSSRSRVFCRALSIATTI